MKKMIFLMTVFVLCSAFSFSIGANKAFDKGLKAFNEGDMHAAKTYFNEALNNDPKFADAYAYLAVTQQKLGETDSAIDNYKLAYRFNKKDGASLTNLCSLLLDKDKKNEAYEVCSKAIEVNPQSFKAYNNRCLLFIQGGRYDSAISDCSRAININSRYTTAYVNRALAYELLKQYDRAVEDYNSAIMINPADALLYNNRCAVYKTMKQYDKAEKDCSKAIALNKELAQAYLNRGAVYEEQGKNADAATDYMIYLKYNNDPAVKAKMQKLMGQQ